MLNAALKAFCALVSLARWPVVAAMGAKIAADLRTTQRERTLARDPHPNNGSTLGYPYDCDAPGYSIGKPKTVEGLYGSRGESGPCGRRKIFPKNFLNYHLEYCRSFPRSRTPKA